MDITTVWTNYVQYVFGNEMLAAAGFSLIVTMIGIRYGWKLESYIVVFVPMLLIVTNAFQPLGIEPLVLMGIGTLIGFGMLAVIRR